MMPRLPKNLGDLISDQIDGACEVLVDTRVGGAPLRLTAEEFRRATRAFARGLLAVGVKPGHRVGFLSANRWELLVGLMGTMLMGAVAVPINYKLASATVAHIIADADASLVFCDAERAAMLPGMTRTLSFDENDGRLFLEFLCPGPLPVCEPSQDQLAEILYTSGSTGVPKGVPLSHTGQLWALGEYLESPGELLFNRTTIVVAPLYHMNALFFTGISLLNGVRVVLMPQFDARTYIAAVSHYGCSVLTGVPTMFALVAALPGDALPSGLACVKRINVGSAPLSTALLEKIRTIFPAAEISNGYGSTEAGPAIFGPHPDGIATPPLSIGYPRSQIDWRLVGGDVPNQGRLQLRTPAMTAGYLNRPEATAEKFSGGWFDTGDILRADEQGFMYFVSRADDMFVCGGENIYPSQVETLLTQHPAVLDALAVGAPDDLKGKVPVAFVVPRRDVAVSEAELRTYCLERGPAYAHPRRIVFKDQFPLGGTQKVDRRALEKEALALMVAEGRYSEDPSNVDRGG